MEGQNVFILEVFGGKVLEGGVLEEVYGSVQAAEKAYCFGKMVVVQLSAITPPFLYQKQSISRATSSILSKRLDFTEIPTIFALRYFE